MGTKEYIEQLGIGRDKRMNVLKRQCIAYMLNNNGYHKNVIAKCLRTSTFNASYMIRTFGDMVDDNNTIASGMLKSASRHCFSIYPHFVECGDSMEISFSLMIDKTQVKL